MEIPTTHRVDSNIPFMWPWLLIGVYIAPVKQHIEAFGNMAQRDNNSEKFQRVAYTEIEHQVQRGAIVLNSHGIS